MLDPNNLDDIRMAIRLLLDAQRLHRLRSLTSSMLVEVILRLPPAKRAAVTREELEPQIAEIRKQMENIVAKQSAELEKILSTDKNFLPALQTYASQQLRD
jgi:hypothetical protein